MKHDPDEQRLTAYLLGELDDKQRTALEAELAESEPLRNELDEIRSTISLVQQGLESEPQFALRDEQRQRIHQQFEFQRKRNSSRAKWFTAGGLSAAASVLLAVLLTMVWRTDTTDKISIASVRQPAEGTLPHSPAEPPASVESGQTQPPQTRKKAPDTVAARGRSQQAKGQESEDRSVAANLSAQQPAVSAPPAGGRLAESIDAPAAPQNIVERKDNAPATVSQPARPGAYVAGITEDEKTKSREKKEAFGKSGKLDASFEEDRRAAAPAERKLSTFADAQAEGKRARAAGVIAGLYKSQLSSTTAGFQVPLAQGELHLRLGFGIERLSWVIGVQAADVTEAEVSAAQVRYSDESLTQVISWPSTGVKITPPLIEFTSAIDSVGLLVHVRAPAKTRVVIESAGRTLADIKLQESLLMRNGVLLQEKVESLQSLLKPSMFSRK